jgi:MFS family permease
VSEPRPGYLLSPRATILALSGVLLGMLLAALNQTIVATALPRIGIVVFMAGAVVGGTATSMTQVVVARAIQGLGAGALIPLAMAVIGDLIPPSDRGRWQGLTGAVFGLASVLGPVPSRELGVATSATQFFCTTGGTIGVSVLLIPEKPLRRSVRESEPAPTPA